MLASQDSSGASHASKPIGVAHAFFNSFALTSEHWPKSRSQLKPRLEVDKRSRDIEKGDGARQGLDQERRPLFQITGRGEKSGCAPFVAPSHISHPALLTLGVPPLSALCPSNNVKECHSPLEQSHSKGSSWWIWGRVDRKHYGQVTFKTEFGLLRWLAADFSRNGHHSSSCDCLQPTLQQKELYGVYLWSSINVDKFLCGPDFRGGKDGPRPGLWS